MRISEAKYTKKINLGNYESEELSLTAVFDESEDVNSSVAALKAHVIAGLNTTASEGEIIKATNQIKKEAGETAAPKEEVKPTKAISKGKKASPTPPAKPAEKESKPEAEKIKDKFEGKAEKATVKYDRDIVEHKQDLAQVLNKDYPTWKTDKVLKERATNFSKNLAQGQAFKAGDGSIVESFQELLKATMEGTETETAEDDL